MKFQVLNTKKNKINKLNLDNLWNSLLNPNNSSNNDNFSNNTSFAGFDLINSQWTEIPNKLLLIFYIKFKNSLKPN